MNKKLYVSPAPHITKGLTTSWMMIAMLMALAPAAVMGVITFKLKALAIIAIAMASSYVFEILFRLLRRQKLFFFDCSSLVTGLMVALTLPVSVPYYFPVIGSFIATVIFKGCFGGLGRNIFNPAAASRVVLGFIFSGLSLALFKGTAIGANVLSPLEYFLKADYSSITIRSLFFGGTTGAIGTCCILCLLVTGIILMCIKVTDFVIPVCSLVTFVAITWATKGLIAVFPYLFSGSFIFAALFMVTDPTTSPVTVWGRLVSGLLFGAFAAMFRVRGVLGETSVFVAVLMVNFLAPMLDKIFAPRPIGARRTE